jgi:hypothetical protein
MADSTAGRSERAEFHDNDPFAELTRIMGRDPRQQDQTDQADYSDLSFDLESELLGDLDLSDEQDEAHAAAPALPSDEELTEARLPEEQEPARWAEPEQPQPAQMQDDPASAELDFADFDDEFTTAFDNSLDDEPALPSEDLAEHVAFDEPVSLDAQEREAAFQPWSVEEQPLPPEEQLAADLDDSSHLAVPEYEAWHDETVEEQGAHDFASAEPDPFEPVAEAPAPDVLDDFDFDALANDLDAIDLNFDAPETETVPEAEAVPAEMEAAPQEVEVVPTQEAAQVEGATEPSLEDELERLLGRGASTSFASDEQVRAEQAPEEQFQPQHTPQEAGVEPLTHVSAAAGASTTDHWTPQAAEAPAEPSVPDIETIEMAEFEPARPEPLEVPDLPVEESVQPQSDFDDLTAELNQAFEFMEQDPVSEPAPAAAAYSASPDPDLDTDFEWDHAAMAAAAGAGGYVAGRGAADAHARHSTAHSLQDRDFTEFNHDAPPEMTRPVGQSWLRLRSGRNRNVAVAAGVVALVLLGGFGAYAFWWGGASGTGEPVLLQADADPVRVRPEDPGGTVVPNQDNEVYQRVAGGQDEAEPLQERLISTAEEPVDLTADDTPSTLGPVAGASDAGQERIDAAKSEERLDTAANESEMASGEDAITLQPRRVRTMVVRPDGSIVPREEVDAASAPAPVSEVGAGVMAQETDQPAALAGDQAGLLPTAGAGLAAGGEQVPSAAEETESSPSMPDRIALAPASRPQSAQQASPTSGQAAPQASQPAAAQQQEQQLAAVDPTPTPPAAASEWSMQIASQPSAESAQQTYQDLARRYSSLLEGRGVNIVRAEVEGRTYYRVRIPMPSRDEAVSLCTRYQSAGGSCFVSR